MATVAKNDDYIISCHKLRSYKSVIETGAACGVAM